MRRFWRVLGDILDAMLVALVHGGHGTPFRAIDRRGFDRATMTIEEQNAEKLRAWSSGEKPPLG